ncbi:PhoH-like phosphate starvation-inducible [Lactococcus phage 949]|uniref:Putative phosphate starvation-inducible protein PhoH/ATPase n=1 Tax=Lactococcus phage 949 TaxID=881953 RepID=E0YJ37_9CAUD|nr:PhoH-like phosphate starvation-inducible [Lactococcus phage 949]ADM73708.1 putative phosphate starvation-inducible protein PhoH/ATPase [Lactococcus phage 949]
MDKKIKYVIDTNAVLNDPNLLDKYDVVIPSIVLKEIEDLELKKSNQVLQYGIRNVKRILLNYVKENNGDIFDITSVKNTTEYTDSYADNVIISFAEEKGYGIITNDVLMYLKATGLGIPVIIPSLGEKDKTIYEGVRNIFINDENSGSGELLLDHIETEIYKSTANKDYTVPKDTPFEENEYIVFLDKAQETYNSKGEHVGYKDVGLFKYNSKDGFQRIGTPMIKGYQENIKPRNVRQRCAVDMLKDPETKVKALFGTFGAGKDYLMLGQALSLVMDDASPIDKLIWVRNNVEVKDSNPIGFLPNSLEEKLKPFLMPMVDHLGGDEAILDELMLQGKIEVQHLGFIRGRDIKNAIIYVTEVQSNTREHIQLLLSRVSDGSQIWFNGDSEQTDSDKFKYNNGVNALRKLAGQELYAQVTLDKTERSAVAQMANLLDEG